MSYRKGIDVSVYQGQIDWEKVKSAGIEYVMIRAGYGSGGIDKKFARNISECNRLGIPCGVYWFSYALTAAMAKKEAECVIAAVKHYKLDLPIAFDFEGDSVRFAAKNGVTVTKTLASAMCRAFCETVKGAGYTPMVYSNPSYLNTYFDSKIPTEYDLWLAQWPGGTPALNVPPRACSVWQYTSSGSVAGIIGRVDMDAVYKDYSGSAVSAEPETTKTDAAVTETESGTTKADRIRLYQKWLNKTYTAGLAVDGVFGPLTLKASVMALQRWLNTAYNCGLSIDGIFGPKTRAAITKGLRNGDAGNGVYVLQGLLYRFGYETGGFDGNFGAKTYAAVRVFQKNKGLTVDGIAGPESFAALCRKVI